MLVTVNYRYQHNRSPMEYITPLWPAYPELFLLVMAGLILILDLFISDDHRVFTYALTQFTLLGCAALTFLTSNAEPIYTFNGMFVDDLMADVLKLLTCVVVIAVLAYSRAYVSARGMFRGEFFTLTLFATLGMMVMISANFVHGVRALVALFICDGGTTAGLVAVD